MPLRPGLPPTQLWKLALDHLEQPGWLLEEVWVRHLRSALGDLPVPLGQGLPPTR